MYIFIHLCIFYVFSFSGPFCLVSFASRRAVRHPESADDHHQTADTMAKVRHARWEEDGWGGWRRCTASYRTASLTVVVLSRCSRCGVSSLCAQKLKSIFIKMISAAQTGFFYIARKNPTKTPRSVGKRHNADKRTAQLRERSE